MRRLGRYILNGLTALSLVLFLATVALWVTAQFDRGPTDERWRWMGVWRDGPLVRLRGRTLDWDAHGLAYAALDVHVLCGVRYDDRLGIVGTPGPADLARADDLRREHSAPALLAKWYGRLSVMYITGPLPGGLAEVPTPRRQSHREYLYGRWLRVVVPFYQLFWAAAALPAVTAGVRLRRRLRRRRRRRDGLCPECGYDLRASPDRCPECGQAA